jgi:hypothetical protein
MSPMQSRDRTSAVSIGLLLLLAFTLVGHICALPHGDDHHAAVPHDSGGHDHDADAVHVASCDGVRSTPPSCPCAPQVTTLLDVEAVASRVARLAVPHRPRPWSSPPLFLLHAALLI